MQDKAGLDLGESEAIVLAQELKIDILLMDEKKGREEAKKLAIPIIGTLGILKLANEKKFMTKEEIFNSLKILKERHRFISEELFEKFISEIK